MEVPGFVGHSLLVHRLPEDRGLEEGEFRIVLSFKTSSSDGVLFYAEGDGGNGDGAVDLSAHISEGVLVGK